MITLPLPDRSLAAVPLSLLGALLIFIAVREPSDPDASPLSSMTDGSGSFPEAAHAAWNGGAFPAIPDAFDYTFVFPLHETPEQDTRVVRLDVGAP